MIQQLFDAIFFGFAIYCLLQFIFVFLPNKNKTKVFAREIDDSVIFTIKYAGVIYYITLVSNLFLLFAGPDPGQASFELSNRLFGPFSLLFWLPFFPYVILTLFLWFKGTRSNFLVRLGIAGFILLAQSADWLLYLFVIKRPHVLPGSWMMIDPGLTGNLFLNIICKLLIFSVLVFFIYRIKQRRILSINSSEFP